MLSSTNTNWTRTTILICSVVLLASILDHYMLSTVYVYEGSAICDYINNSSRKTTNTLQTCDSASIVKSSLPKLQLNKFESSYMLVDRYNIVHRLVNISNIGYVFGYNTNHLLEKGTNQDGKNFITLKIYRPLLTHSDPTSIANLLKAKVDSHQFEIRTQMKTVSINTFQHMWRHSNDLQANADTFTTVLSELKDDIHRFLDSFQLYHLCGRPYHRIYLLTGVPGGGKTSAVRMVAALSDRQIYNINLADKEMSDSMFIDAVSSIPGGQIILLDEFDSTLIRNTSLETGTNTNYTYKPHEYGITTSTFLSFLDGTNTPNNSIIFIITNDMKQITDHFTDHVLNAVERRLSNHFHFGKLSTTESIEYVRAYASQYEFPETTVSNVIQKLKNMDNETADGHLFTLGEILEIMFTVMSHTIQQYESPTIMYTV